MKIVLDAREYSTTTGRYMSRLIQYLQRIDNDNDYVVLLKPADFDICELTNPRFTKVVCRYKEFSFGEQIGFAIQLYRLRADLVHFGMTQQPITYWRPSVTTINDLTTARFKNPTKNQAVLTVMQQVYKLVIWYAAWKSRKVLTYSEFVKQDVARYTHISPAKITVAKLAADPITEPPASLPALQNKKFIMYIGRPMPHKNLERLIEAFRLLQAQHPALRLVLAGKKDANYKRIEAKVQAEGPRNVVFTDFITEGQLRWLYEHCSAYVFPSLSEGFGLPGLEAMAHGAPVVSSNATCLPEIYGEAAHYFDPLDVQAMADAINEVLTDKKLRAGLVTKGHQRTEAFSWKRLAEQTLSVYKVAVKYRR